MAFITRGDPQCRCARGRRGQGGWTWPRVRRAAVLGTGPERAGFLGSDHCPLLVELAPAPATATAGGGAASSTSSSIVIVRSAGATELEATVARITQRYDELSTKYHAEKAANPLNTMAFN